MPRKRSDTCKRGHPLSGPDADVRWETRVVRGRKYQVPMCRVCDRQRRKAKRAN